MNQTTEKNANYNNYHIVVVVDHAVANHSLIVNVGSIRRVCACVNDFQ